MTEIETRNIINDLSEEEKKEILEDLENLSQDSQEDVKGKLEEKNYIKALNRMAFEYENNHIKNFNNEKENKKKAIEYYEKAGKMGYNEAFCYIGDIYLKGDDVEKDINKAMEYYEKAGEEGLIRLGKIYLEGNGVEKDINKAIDYYKKVKNTDVLRIISSSLYDFYENNINNLENTQKQNILDIFVALAKNGNKTILDKFGDIYSKDKTLNPEKKEEILNILMSAAKEGNRKVLNKLGNIYSEDKTLNPEKKEEILNTFQELAKKGNKTALKNLEKINPENINLDPKNDEKTPENLLVEAKNGNQTAILDKLGDIYSEDKTLKSETKEEILDTFKKLMLEKTNPLIQSAIRKNLNKIYKEDKDPDSKNKIFKIYQDNYQEILKEDNKNSFKDSVLGGLNDLYSSLDSEKKEKILEIFLQEVKKENNIASLTDIAEYLNNIRKDEGLDNKKKEEILEAFKIMISKGNSKATECIADFYLSLDNDTKKEEILKNLQKAVNNGNEEALGSLTKIYRGDKNLNDEKKKEILNIFEEKILLNENFKNSTLINYIGQNIFLETEKDEQKAFEYIKKAADLNNPFAINNLGYYYANGIGVVKNEEEAFKFYKEAADQGVDNAYINLGICYEKGFGCEKNEKKAFNCYEKNKNSLESKFYLFKCYKEGIGTEKDEQKAEEYYQNILNSGGGKIINKLGDYFKEKSKYEKEKSKHEKAFEMYKKAASLGDNEALKNIGDCYLNGEGVEENLDKTIEYWKNAAEKGNKDAAASLGENYYYEGNLKLALEYYEKGTALGDGYSASMIADIYLNGGDNIEKDEKKAIEYYKKASDLGDDLSSEFLGNAYANGNYGLEKDPEKAFKYFEKTVKNINDNVVLSRVIENYIKGENGLEKDPEKAIYLLETAEKNGNTYAMFKLGDMYAEGIGIEKNKEKAIEYYEKAVKRSNDGYAFYKLGNMYINEKNFEEAVKYLQKAVDIDGREYSAFNLALCYENAKGIEQNFEEARKNYEKVLDDFSSKTFSINNNYFFSMLNLAYYYENGIGGEKNEEKAKKLYEKIIDLRPESIKDIIDSYEKGDTLCNKDPKKVERFSQIAAQIEERKKQINEVNKQQNTENGLKTQVEEHNNNIDRFNNTNEKKQSIENPNKYKIDKFAKDISSRKGAVSIKQLNLAMEDIPEKRELLENKEFLKMRVSKIEVDGKSYRGFGGNMNYSPETNNGKITITFKEGEFFMDQLKRMGMDKEYEMFKNGAIVINNTSKLGEDGIADLMAKFKVNPIKAYKEICNNKDIEIKYTDEKNPEGQKIDGELGKTIENSLEKTTNARNTMSNIIKYSENIEQNKDNNLDQDYKKIAKFVNEYSMNILKDGVISDHISSNTTGLNDSIAIGKQAAEYLKVLDSAINKSSNITEEQNNFLNTFKEKQKAISNFIDKEEMKESVFVNCISSTFDESLKKASKEIKVMLEKEQQNQQSIIGQ